MLRLNKFFYAAGIVLLTISTSSCNNAGNNEAAGNDTAQTAGNDTARKGQHAVAVLSATFPDTAVNGTVLFDQQPDGKILMKLKLNIPSKANKSVAVHIHENGNCGDTAKSAGPHWNPTGASHGKWKEGSFHAGDIGNVDLDAQGNGEKVLESDMWTIGGDAKTNILNKSVVVHSGKDDLRSQPAGNSGSRIGCGVIREGSE